MANIKLIDICEKIGSGATPRGGKEAYCDEGISFIRSQNVLDFTFSRDGLAFINDEQAKKLSNVEVHDGDVLLNITGDSVARACVMDSDFLPARVNQHVAIVRGNKKHVLNNYILYFLQWRKDYLLQLASAGATRNALTKGMIEQLEIDLPPLIDQKKIVVVLDLLQSKIVLNQKINDNLQQQSAAIFSDWLETHATSSREVTLGEVCIKVTDGSHFSPKDDPTSSIPMLSVKDMDEYDFNFTSCKHISEEDYQKMQTNDCVPKVNDILVAKDGSYLKEIFVCNERRKLAVLSSIAIFRPNTEIIYTEILLAFLKSPRVLQEVRDNYVSGSALPRIVLKDFKKLKFSLPSMQAQSEITDVMIAYRRQIALNIQENQRLEALRDALLPKLMSGEVDVSDVQL